MFSDQERCTHAVPAGQGKGSVEALRCRRKVLGSSGDVVDRAWVVVRSVEEAHKVLSKATSRRAVAAHKMNARSSRSHLIVSLELRESRSAPGEKSPPQRRSRQAKRRPSLRERPHRPRSLSPVPSPQTKRKMPRIGAEASDASDDDGGYGSEDCTTPKGVDHPAWKQRGCLIFVDLAGSEVSHCCSSLTLCTFSFFLTNCWSIVLRLRLSRMSRNQG